MGRFTCWGGDAPPRTAPGINGRGLPYSTTRCDTEWALAKRWQGRSKRTVAAAAALFFGKPGESWLNLIKFLGAAFLAAAVLVFWLNAILRKLISSLANSDQARMNSLILGAILLTVSTIRQLALTF